MRILPLVALAALALAPAATAQADPDPSAPSAQPPASANPMGGTAQPGNLGDQPSSGGPKASSNADTQPAERPGPPDFPENNELPDHGGPDLPPRQTPPAVQQQPAAPQAQQAPAQPAPPPQPAPEPAQQPVSQQQPQTPAQPDPAQSLIPQHLPGIGDLGVIVNQVLGALPAGR